jgi:hypothetical protein
MSVTKFLVFERLFDRSVSVLLIAMGAFLAGATAVSGI